MSDNTHELLNTTYTKDNLHRKVTLLEEFFELFYFKDHKEGRVKERLKDFLIEEQIGEYLRSNLLMLSDGFFTSITADNFRDVLVSVKEEEKNLPHLTLYVATILPPVEVEKLGKWAREHIAPGLFLDLEIDSNVVGGCAFVWNGIYHDYSLSYYIDQKRKEIRGLLTGT